MKDEGLREKAIKGLEFCTQHGSMCGSDCDGHYERYTDDGYVIKLVNEYRSKCPYGKCETGCVKTLAKDALELLKEQEPRVLTLDEAAAAQEVWVEAWLSVPKKYVIMVTSLYLTDDCKNFELELLGTDKKAFMLAEAYGHTWRCWSAKPTDDQRKAVKWDE